MSPFDVICGFLFIYERDRDFCGFCRLRVERILLCRRRVVFRDVDRRFTGDLFLVTVRRDREHDT